MNLVNKVDYIHETSDSAIYDTRRFCQSVFQMQKLKVQVSADRSARYAVPHAHAPRCTQISTVSVINW